MTDDLMTHDVVDGGVDGDGRAGLWPGDTGRLSEHARRALLRLVKGPYLSSDTHPQLWSALLADDAEIRSRLHDLFLDLVIDEVLGFAFVRNAATGEVAAPSAVRTETLTFLDTAMLLVLRQLLLTADGERRVIVGRDEVFDQLQVYRTADRDDADFRKRLNASWSKMGNTLRVIHASEGAGTAEERVEISPVLALIVDADQVQALQREYDQIAAGGAGADGAVSEGGGRVDAAVGNDAGGADRAIPEASPVTETLFDEGDEQ